MESLRAFLNGKPLDEQEAFAHRCDTSLGYLRKVLSTGQELGLEIVIALERESGGEVRCEDVRPDVDWHYLRTSKKRAKPN
jgi:DNA-binding transcriptional regulator YdaS (Cro superfamily)